jgi:hypothetical protein
MLGHAICHERELADEDTRISKLETDLVKSNEDRRKLGADRRVAHRYRVAH